jgi:flagellar motility protein MotE (MotC chaperone)
MVLAVAAAVPLLLLAFSRAHGEPAAKSPKAAAQNAAAAGKPPKPQPLPEVKPQGPLAAQYCEAVRDQALEARHAVVTARLEGLAKEIDERLATLDQRSAELRIWLQKREEFSKKATMQLVGIYAGMRPEAASESLSRLDPGTAAAILAKLETRAASAILNDMPADKAASLAAILSGSAQRDEPARIAGRGAEK